MSKTWLITGASRGIGREIAKAAYAAGDNVVVTARNIERLKEYFPEGDRIAFATLDVTHPEHSAAAVALAAKRFGSLDVLVNNAGYGQLGHFENITPDAIETQFQTNVFGLMNVTRSALPVMRAQRNGHIINISSIGGALGFDGASIYCSTKFAVEGFSESLSLELERFGIYSTVVEPGFFRTDFLDSQSIQYGSLSVEDYQTAAEELKGFYDSRNHTQSGDPSLLAQRLIEITHSEHPPVRFIAGSDALEISRSVLKQRTDELEAWAVQSVSTDFKD